MQRFTRIAALLVVSSILAACGGQGAVQSLPSDGGLTQQSVHTGGLSIADRNGWKPYFLDMKPINLPGLATLQAQAAAGSTIPFFTSKVKSPLDHNTYTYSIVGADPHTSKTTTNVSYVPIVLRVHFPGGVVLDPTKPGCSDTVSVQDRFYKGPDFVNVPLKSNGINVGTTQVIDGLQRAQWWSVVKGTGYHTIYKASGNPIVVDFTPSGGSVQGGACSGSSHDLGLVDINVYDSEMQALANKYAKTNQVPMVLSYNVVLTSGGCCIIGYHNAFGRSGGTQVYAVGAYTDGGIFTGIQDIHAWTHEIGELTDDPFINNNTPLWGHVGQVQGCQGNLENGDPLTGTPFLVKLNGFTYHPQELVFFDWFFRTPAEGTGGEFSFEGTFETSQNTVC